MKEGNPISLDLCAAKLKLFIAAPQSTSVSGAKGHWHLTTLGASWEQPEQLKRWLPLNKNMNTGDDRIITNLWGKKQDKKKWVVKTLKQKVPQVLLVTERIDLFGKDICWLWWGGFGFWDFWILNSLGSQTKTHRKIWLLPVKPLLTEFQSVPRVDFFGMLPVQSEQWRKRPLLLMEEIPNNHLGCIKPVVNEGITYQPQLVSWISEPSTVVV